LNTLLQQLADLTAGLERAAGVSAEQLATLRRWLAAWLIQQAPGLAPVQDEPGADSELLAAAHAGEELAAELTAGGRQLRWRREPYPTPPGAEAVEAIVGPFVDQTLTLVQFTFVVSTPFMRVTHRDIAAGIPRMELLMLLPAGTTSDDTGHRWTIPAGTVWLRANRLVPGAAGYAGLRVAAGELTVTHPRRSRAGIPSLSIPFSDAWRLVVRPEPVAEAAAGDGMPPGLAVTVPTLIDAGPGRPPVITGSIGIGGWGSALRIDGPPETPHADDDALVFPYRVAEVSSVLRLESPGLWDVEGRAEVGAAAWTIARMDPLPDAPAEAASGGSLRLNLRQGLTVSLPDGVGALQVSDVLLQADGRGVACSTGRADAGVIELPLAMWKNASARWRLGPPALGALRVEAWRDLAAAVHASGVQVEQRWDCPLDAADRPFEFAAGADVRLVGAPQGYRHVQVLAARDPGKSILGWAFENLYLHLHPARSSAWVAGGETLSTLHEGWASMSFDVVVAQPMLPDPYATNWRLDHLDFPGAASALGVRLRWQAAPPVVAAALKEPPSFPETWDLRDRAFKAHGVYRDHLNASDQGLALLDLSTRAQQFGIALEDVPPQRVELDDSGRMQWPLQAVRLFLQPQIHWEPLQLLNQLGEVDGRLDFTLGHGGPTLIGAASDRRVPALPGPVSDAIVGAAGAGDLGAASFNLPFGLLASVLFGQSESMVSAPAVEIHQPDLSGLGFEAARQLRLSASGVGLPAGAADPMRALPGIMTTEGLAPLGGAARAAVFGDASAADLVDSSFASSKLEESSVPLHQVDLSGYGLSTFSRWRMADEEATGVSQAYFDVVVGRTSYEVIQLQSKLWAAQCRVTRTYVMERRNSGHVTRFDSGWQAASDGEFRRYVPDAVDTGLVQAYRRIRNIRVVPSAVVVAGAVSWQKVLFDADLHLAPYPGHTEHDRTVPVRDHVGYVQVSADKKPAVPAAPAPAPPPFVQQPYADLMARVGSLGGPVDASIRLGGTLQMHCGYMEVGRSDRVSGETRFVVAVSGSPRLPRAGQWLPARIDGTTRDVAALDARRGLPVVRRSGEVAFTFRDPDKAYDPGGALYGLLMCAPSGRVLFAEPSITPGDNKLRAQPPLIADPAALSQASGAFPRPQFALQASDEAVFDIDAADGWKLLRSSFPIAKTDSALASGSGWLLKRKIDEPSAVTLVLDTLDGRADWAIERGSDVLDLYLDGAAKPSRRHLADADPAAGRDARRGEEDRQCAGRVHQPGLRRRCRRVCR